MDFSDDEACRQKINAWVAENTGGHIKELLARGSLQGGSALVLSAALHFKAAWALPFSESGTRPEPFHLLNGTSAEVPTMRLCEELQYGERAGHRAVRLPYLMHECSLWILLPPEGVPPRAALESTELSELAVNAGTPGRSRYGYPSSRCAVSWTSRRAYRSWG